MTERGVGRLPDELSLTNGWKLNVIGRRRQPLSYGCRMRGQFEKDCSRAENTNVEVEAAREEENETAGKTMEGSSRLCR